MAAPSQQLIDQLLAAAQDAREATREAREARKDLRQATKEAKEIIDKYLVDSLNEEIRRVWKGYMDEVDIEKLGEGLKKTFGQWTDLLADGNEILSMLKKKEELLTEVLENTGRRFG